jgi:hypothetical protein
MVEHECTFDDEVEFDEEAAQKMTADEVQKKFPRKWSKCNQCGKQWIRYASKAHYLYGDW